MIEPPWTSNAFAPTNTDSSFASPVHALCELSKGLVGLDDVREGARVVRATQAKSQCRQRGRAGRKRLAPSHRLLRSALVWGPASSVDEGSVTAITTSSVRVSPAVTAMTRFSVGASG